MLLVAFVAATIGPVESTQKGDTTAPVAGSPHCVRVIEGASEVHDLDISPDGARVVVGLANGHALVYDLKTGAREADLFQGAGWAWDVAFDPTGSKILVVHPQVARVWNAATFELERTLGEQKLGMIRGCFSPDGKRIATGSTGNSVQPDEETEARVWDLETGKVIATIPGLTFRVLPSFRPDGKALLASSEGSGRLCTLDLDDARTVRPIGKRECGVAHSAWSPDGKTVLSVGADACGRLSRADTGKELHVLRGHTGYMVWCEFSPDGKEVSTTSWQDRTTRIWNTSTGKERLVLSGHTDRPVRTRFAPDGRALASVDAVGVGLLFELRGGTVAARFEGHTGIVTCVGFTPDSKLVVTGGHDGSVRVWKNPVVK